MDWSMFWASVFPAYLGAVGSIAASAVAVIAFLRDIRTRKGTERGRPVFVDYNERAHQ